MLDQRLAGQAVAAIDDHRVRAADAVRTGAAQRQGAVLIPFDLVQHVKDLVIERRLNLIRFPVGLLVLVRIEALNLDIDLHHQHSLFSIQRSALSKLAPSAGT